MKKILFIPMFLAFTLLLAGCGGGGGSDINSYDDFFKDPSGEPIKATVRTTVPLAYATSVAMEAFSGAVLPNVSIIKTGSTALVTIDVDENTLPFVFASSGQILVYGLWTSPDDAILTVLFVDMSVGSSLFQVHNVSTFPVSRDPITGVTTIVYTNIDVNVATPVDPQTLSPGEIIDIQALFFDITIGVSDKPEVNLGMDAWVVDVDHAGTPDVFSDDTYTINGGGQYVDAGSGGGSILQLGMVGTIMAPECALNPVDGLAVMNEVAASVPGLPVVAMAMLSFEPECDGTAKVLLATGNYVLSNGQSIPLHLNVP